MYSAARRTGEVVKGEREAENEKILAQTLKSEGLFLLGAKPKIAGARISSLGIGEFLYNLLPVSIVEKMFFTRNLAVMISAGLSLNRALDTLKEEMTNPKFKKILEDIGASVLGGKSFAESMRAHEKVFGHLFINMVEVGEATGKLTLVLKLLSNQMKKDYDLRKRVRGAMIYPVIILIALAGVGVAMMVYVVPMLSQTIKDLGVELPLMTRIIIGISDILSKYFIWFMAALILFIFFARFFLKTSWGKSIFDRVILRFPVFGSLVKKFNLARFSRTLVYLITSGVSIVRSLEVTSTILGNSLYREAVEAASREIQKGKQLNVILAPYHNLFPPVVIQMISVGEETGKLSNLLLRLALFFEEDVNNTTKNLSTIIEPMLMLIIGVAVGFFAVAMLQPIYSSLGNI